MPDFLPSPDRPYAEVIGDPIKQSKSPLIHGFWAEQAGLDVLYRQQHVAAADLGAYFAARTADPLFKGCNITIPHKIAALDHVPDPGDVRGSIGAINTVARAKESDGASGAFFGTNTDAGGFAAPISDRDWTGESAILIGAGGAARAIVFALKALGFGQVSVMARNPMKGMGLLGQFGMKGEVLPMDAALPPASLLVNASPLGMTGQGALEVDLSPLPDDAVVYDIVYTPLETALLKAARARDLMTVDGLEMLIGQAAIAFELLFGQAPPKGDEQDAALRDILLRP